LPLTLDAAPSRRYDIAPMKDWLRARLDELREHQLLRDPADNDVQAKRRARGEPPLLDACSNDYLGLGGQTVSRETLQAIEGSRIGAGAARLVQGNHAEHLELEQALAEWTGNEAALVSVSAFAVNAGLIPALSTPESLVVSDELNHASLIDGCRLARAKVVVTPHLEVEPVERALRERSAGTSALVVVESLFSMDGDSPDLPALRALCDRYGAWLIVDEAHALGVFGPEGAGLAAALGARPDALVGGLGKAVGAQGGFVAGSVELRTWLWNRSRPFVFSTAMSPLLCRATLQQVKATRDAEGLRSALRRKSLELRSALRARSIPVLRSEGPIVPVLLGSNERALTAMALLREAGILAQAIRPPTVAIGAARLRLTVHADWPDDATARITGALERACAS
jgi:8-amino-7-oxononanoate synthase